MLSIIVGSLLSIDVCEGCPSQFNIRTEVRMSKVVGGQSLSAHPQKRQKKSLSNVVRR